MRNALLQCSSHLYSFGNNYEFQMPNLDVSMQMNSDGDIHGNGFLMKPVVSNNTEDGLQLGNGCHPGPFRSLLNNYSYQSGYQSGSSTCDDIIPQQSLLLSKRPFVPQFEKDLQGMPNVRKRPIELINDSLPKIGTDIVGNMAVLSEWKKNKRNRASTPDTKICQDQVHVPAKRSSQKLSDKITALQKLVSPYGKTDTASVLHEASLYIKLLHDQIQNLFQTLGSSYKSSIEGPRSHKRQVEIGEQLNLRSKGLCLVPVSVTQKVKNGELC